MKKKTELTEQQETGALLIALMCLLIDKKIIDGTELNETITTIKNGISDGSLEKTLKALKGEIRCSEKK